MTAAPSLRRGVAHVAIIAALALGGSAVAWHAAAQDALLPGGIGKQVPDGTPLLLEADRLIYNRDADTVTARGAVQIAYGPYRLVAQEISYNQRTGRLVARGEVELVEPDGNRIYADEVDVTDDFADGFVNALRVETSGNTRFAAQSAVRGDGGATTVFNNGVYTACEVCEDDPQKPLTWRVRAQTVIWRQQERTVTFENPSFELFGVPLVTLPGFTIPDHTVRRQSGFLTPSVGYTDELGASLTVPYYIALSPHYDATVEATAFSRQGLLGEAQFRRRFQSGDLEFRAAAIYQLAPEAFDEGTTDDTDGRAMFGGRGDFRINERWQWGFDFLAQTDGSFASTYDIDGYDSSTFINNIYLVGLDDRSYFEIKAEEYTVQSSDLEFENENPVVYPSLDYERTFDTQLLGGDVTLNVNAVHLTRDEQACRTAIPSAVVDAGFVTTENCDVDPRLFDPFRLGNREEGIDGNYSRATGELVWQGTYTTPQGLVLSPLLAARADGVSVDVDTPRAVGQPEIGETDSIRTMTTAGIEARYPIMVTAPGGVQIFEPIAQLFVRPDEDRDGAVVNEDSQSLVFDTDSLFERDKFSGYDRVEGGTRLNLGLRYAANLDNGVTIDATVGQSFHLAGDNPFADDGQLADLTNAGAQSGLDTDRSDYVAGIGVSLPNGLDFGAEARFDQETFDVERAEVEAIYSGVDFTAVAKYAFVDEQPDVQTLAPRHEVQAAAVVALGENWAINANASYDIEAGTIWRHGAGLEYADECFAYSLSYTENRRNLDAIDRSVNFNVSLRTIGDFGSSRRLATEN